MPRRRRKLNLHLIEVLGASLVVHVAALLVLGGITIWTALMPKEPEMEAPPSPPSVDQEQLKFKVRLSQQQKKSSRARAKIAVTNMSQINMPSLDLDVPVINTRVAVGGGVGGGIGLGNFGGGGIDLSKSAVDFFGIKSEGERVMFLIDASRYMLEDEKGGIPAYNIIKGEVVRMVKGLQPGTLFNAMFFYDGSVQALSPRMLPATSANKDHAVEWIQPVNQHAGQLGIQGNISITHTDIQPLGDDVSHWARAVQIAMEQGCDVIFLLVPQWQWHGRQFANESERQTWLTAQGWTPEKETQWQEATRQAYAWLGEENARRASKGMPPKINHSTHDLIIDMKAAGLMDKSTPLKPGNEYRREEVVEHITNAAREIYRGRDNQRPPVNIVLFLGSDEDEKTHPDVDWFKQVARKNRGGKFRVLEGESDLMRAVNRS